MNPVACEDVWRATKWNKQAASHFLLHLINQMWFCFEPGWFRKCRHLHVSVWHPIIIPESDLDKRGQQFKQNKIHYSVASSPDTVSRQLDPQRTPAGCWWCVTRWVTPDRSLTHPRCRWQQLSHLASSWGRCVETACAVGKQILPL